MPIIFMSISLKISIWLTEKNQVKNKTVIYLIKAAFYQVDKCIARMLVEKLQNPSWLFKVDPESYLHHQTAFE